jgi:Protein of unknown function (DUF2510)
MALRPFARHQKRKADDETTPSAADEFAQFFSNDPRPDDPSDTGAAAPAPEVVAPAVTMEEQSAAGWYPDTKDPGLMRYWDGFHLTGQTMRVGPPPPVAAEPAEPVEAAEAAVEAPTPPPVVPATAVIPTNPSGPPARFATDLLAPDVPQAPLLGSRLLTDTAADKVAAAEPPQPAPAFQPMVSKTAADEPVTAVEEDAPEVTPVAVAPIAAAPAPVAAVAAPPVAPAVAPAVSPPVAPAAAPAAVESDSDEEATEDTTEDTPTASESAAQAHPTPEPPTVKTPDQTHNWAERTEQAVTKAQASGTPEAWQEAAQAAAVVSEMAQTMQTAADIRQSAEQLERAAEEAQHRADEAQEAAAEAQRTVQETGRAAREAADAAEAATRKAEEAKGKAEQAAEATPRVAERAKDAAQASAAAKRRAQLVEEIVARAHQADTPEAWSEARRSAERATDAAGREGRTPGA